MNIFVGLSAPLALVALSACGGQDYVPLSLEVSGNSFIATGVIDGSTPETIRNAIAANPGVVTLVLQNVPGSADDEANLQAARSVRAANLTTIVPSGGMVASGGTDLFLAGAVREIGAGACLGVHSWSTDGSVEGKDVPRSDPQHQLYLKYYAEMGIPSAFYWYTLEAADASNIHWMKNAEINAYQMTTTPVTFNVEASATACDQIGG